MEIDDLEEKKVSQFKDILYVTEAGIPKGLPYASMVDILESNIDSLAETLDISTEDFFISLRTLKIAREIYFFAATLQGSILNVSTDKNIIQDFEDGDRLHFFIEESLPLGSIAQLRINFLNSSEVYNLGTPINSHSIAPNKDFELIFIGGILFPCSNLIPDQILVASSGDDLIKDFASLVSIPEAYIYLGDTPPSSGLSHEDFLAIRSFRQMQVSPGSYQVPQLNYTNTNTTNTLDPQGVVQNSPLEANALNIKLYKRTT